MQAGHALVVLAITSAAISFVAVTFVECAQLPDISKGPLRNLIHVTRCCTRAASLRFPLSIAVFNVQKHLGHTIDVMGFMLFVALGVYADMLNTGCPSVPFLNSSVLVNNQEHFSICRFRYLAVFWELLLSSIRMLPLQCIYNRACRSHYPDSRAVCASDYPASIDT